MMTNIESTTPSQRLRELRLKLDLNQKEFALQLDIKQGSVSDIERGKSSVSNKVAHKIEIRFKVNLSWLMFGSGEIFQSINSNTSYELIDFIESLEGKNIQDSTQDDKEFRANASMLFEIKEIVKQHIRNNKPSAGTLG